MPDYAKHLFLTENGCADLVCKYFFIEDGLESADAVDIH